MKIAQGTHICSPAYTGAVYHGAQCESAGQLLICKKTNAIFFYRATVPGSGSTAGCLRKRRIPTILCWSGSSFLPLPPQTSMNSSKCASRACCNGLKKAWASPAADGMTPDALLAQITGEMHAFVADQYACWNAQLHPALSAEGIRVLRWSELGEIARKAASGFYQREVDPLLTPITIDPRHPFPRVLNKALSIALLLRSKRRGAGMSGRCRYRRGSGCGDGAARALAVRLTALRSRCRR